MIELVLGFILGWLVAVLYLSMVVKDTIIKLSKSAEVKIKAKTDVPIYYAEQHGNQMYLWDDSNTFVTQATDISELLQNLHNTIKQERAVVVTPNEKIYIRNGDVLLRDARRSGDE